MKLWNSLDKTTMDQSRDVHSPLSRTVDHSPWLDITEGININQKTNNPSEGIMWRAQHKNR